MNLYDGDMKTKDEGWYSEKLAEPARSSDYDNLFAILEEAEREHHDALVELKGIVGPRKRQFRLLQGGVCLLKTSPGKA